MAESVHQRKRELAKGRLNQAFNLKVSDQNEAALASLADAVRTDPDLVTDTGAVGLAQALTGLPRDKAIQLLTVRSKEPITESARPQFALPSETPTVILELIVLLIIYLVFSAILNVSILRAANNILDHSSLGSTVSTRLHDALAQIQPADLLIATLKSGVLWVVITALGILAMYLVGTLMGGVGSFPRFLQRALVVYAGIVILFIVGMLIALFAVSNYDANPSLASTLSLIGGWIILLTAPVGILVLARIAARTHEFGYFKGLGSVLIANIIASLLAIIFGLFRI